MALDIKPGTVLSLALLGGIGYVAYKILSGEWKLPGWPELKLPELPPFPGYTGGTGGLPSYDFTEEELVFPGVDPYLSDPVTKEDPVMEAYIPMISDRPPGGEPPYIPTPQEFRTRPEPEPGEMTEIHKELGAKVTVKAVAEEMVKDISPSNLLRLTKLFKEQL